MITARLITTLQRGKQTLRHYYVSGIVLKFALGKHVEVCPPSMSGETGADEWQKLTILERGGTPVKFDPPMMVKYTHSGTKSNSGKSYDGANFYLEYGCFGDIYGIPSFCVNKNGEKGNCDENSRWVNEFVVKAGSLATQVKDGTTEYVIKPLEIEQTMKKASSAATCTDAGLSLCGVSLPDSSDWSDPDIGDKLTVTGPPAIVGGAKTGS